MGADGGYKTVDVRVPCEKCGALTFFSPCAICYEQGGFVALWWWHPRHWALAWPRRTTGIYAQTFRREGQLGPLELRWRTRVSWDLA